MERIETYQSIKISDDLTDIILMPIDGFYIRKSSRYDFSYKILLYKLILTDKTTSIITQSIIPYYISDGYTNEFRANILFPFMCFRKDNQCIKNITTNLSDGGLVKYRIASNINSNIMIRWIEKRLVNIYGHEAVSELHMNSADNSIGITSVLKRIENLLDYLICISSYEIYKFNNRDIKCFRPVYDESKKYDISYCDNFDGFDINDEYRLCLMKLFNKHIMMLIDNSIIELTYIPVNFTSTTKQDFNNFKFANICEDYTDNIINVAAYAEISLKLHHMIIAKLHIDEKNDNIPTIKNILDNDTIYINNVNKYNVLDENINVWGNCIVQTGGYYNKYLMYKLKYVKQKLKNNFNIN